MQIISYITISGPESDLATEVIEKIKEGYIPQGGVSMCIVEDNMRLLAQAMIRYAPPEKLKKKTIFNFYSHKL